MWKSVILVITLFLLSFSNVYASDNIRTIDNIISEKEILTQAGEKVMLAKQWYDCEFEISPVNTIGPLEMQSVDSEEYMLALHEVQFPVESVGEYKVYFLTYKLRDYFSTLAMSFKDGSTVVFGTYTPLTKEKLHLLAVHELGHQVDFRLMTDEKWKEYKKLRGLTDQKKYNDASEIYPNRPQEIFAEDFRILFGGEDARTAAHLNADLTAPDQIPGLKEFYQSLVQ